MLINWSKKKQISPICNLIGGIFFEEKGFLFLEFLFFCLYVSSKLEILSLYTYIVQYNGRKYIGGSRSVYVRTYTPQGISPMYLRPLYYSMYVYKLQISDLERTYVRTYVRCTYALPIGVVLRRGRSEKNTPYGVFCFEKSFSTLIPICTLSPKRAKKRKIIMKKSVQLWISLPKLIFIYRFFDKILFSSKKCSKSIFWPNWAKRPNLGQKGRFVRITHKSF